MAPLPPRREVPDWLPETNADLAFALAERGVRVFPCDPATKRPYIKWQGPETGDPAKVRQWWTTWPNAMPGIGLGDSNLLVVDVDGGQEGVDAWEAYAAEQGGLPRGVPAVWTPSGGLHYYFRLPDGVRLGNSRGALPPKTVMPVDIRGTTNGYVIACGAERSDGTDYRPVDSLDLFSWLDAPLIPDWLLGVLQGETQRAEPAALPAKLAAIAPTITTENVRVKAWIETAFADEVNGVATCPKGSRNEQLNKAAFALYQFVAAGFLTDAEVHAALVQAAQANGSARDDGMPQTLKTIASGKRGGMQEPRQIPADILQEQADIEAGRAIARRIMESKSGVITDADTGEVLHDPADMKAAIDESLSDHLTHVPGLVGEITDWITATARKPNRVMALAGAIAVIGTALGRHFATPTMSGTHNYMLTLAPTGAGKDHAIQQVRRIMASCGMEHSIGGNDYSAQSAIQVALLERPIILSAMDEIGVFLKRINSRRAGGFEAGISGFLRTLWGVNFNSVPTTRMVGKQSYVIWAPALSIFGVSTFAEFFKGLDGADLSNGFLNRFLMFTVEKRPDPVEPALKPNVVPPSIQAAMKARWMGDSALGANRTHVQATTEVDPVIVPWASGPAQAEYQRLERDILAMGDERPETEAFFARTAEMAVRLATIRAVGINYLKPAVTLDDMRWGEAIAWHSAATMMRMAGLYMAENEHQEHAMRIKRILAELGGKATKRTIKRRLGHAIERRKLEELLKLMEEAGDFRVERNIPPGGGTVTELCIVEDYD